MTRMQSRPGRRRNLLGAGMLLALLFSVTQALALEPADLIIVYNRNLPESRTVANYYARKRAVPLGNMVGVDVSFAEKMARKDFDQNLLPPVQALVKKLKKAGKTPAVLLVYGIPLRVGEAEFTPADKALKELAEGKVKEYQGLVVHMAREIDTLTAASSPPPAPPEKLPTSYAIPEVIEMVEASMERGVHYLEKPGRPEDAGRRARTYSLLIRLSGTSPAAKAMIGKMAQGDPNDRKTLMSQELLKWDAVLKRGLGDETFWGIMPENALDLASSVRLTDGLLGELKFWEEVRDLSNNPQTAAAVDSELTMVLVPRYQKAKWLPNPFHGRYDRLPDIKLFRQNTVMVGRLDGPTPEIAKRLVDDALETEKVGLRGTFYIDARGLADDGKYGSYAWYDRHLRDLYQIIKTQTSMQVVIDQRPELFEPGSCPDAALYVGWYSLGNYVASCAWRKGAVAFHVASAEASTLRDKNSKVWCKRLLEEGVAATLGPVSEPYLSSFPLPDEFFPRLLTGREPLIEVFFRTLPFVSWRQILIGDPLYTPFKKNPALRPNAAKR